MQRVIAGRLRGRRLKQLSGSVEGVRPTGSRARGALFDRLAAEVQGMRVLDLFAGTGALSIEALSRGASFAVCVEQRAPVARFLEGQLQALGLEAEVQIWRGDVRAFLGHEPGSRPLRCEGPFDLVVVDPPYELRALQQAVVSDLVDGAWLAPGAVVVCEYARGRGLAPLVWSRRLAPEARREYGQTVLEFLRFEGER